MIASNLYQWWWTRGLMEAGGGFTHSVSLSFSVRTRWRFQRPTLVVAGQVWIVYIKYLHLNWLVRRTKPVRLVGG
jgi:hypothetical protein